ncbi:MAG: hypothetical protein R2939_21630 [Kofleriaceae bacterium]
MHRPDRVRAWVLALAIVLISVAVARPARADVRADVTAKIKAAMENFDVFEYDAARKLLTQALAKAKKAKLQNDPLTAQIHLALGIVSFAGLQDEDAARLAFLDAAQIDPTIEIDPAYRTPEMAALLDEARAEFGGDGTPPPPSTPAVDCAIISGIEHDLVESGTAGTSIEIVAYVGLDTPANRVVLSYRSQGAEAFDEVDMVATDECAYVGTIPGVALRGQIAYYFISAYGSGGKLVSQRGSDGSPNLVELAPGTGGGDDEDPLGGGRRDVPGGVVAGGKPAKVFVGVAVGSGLGYVTGTTEQAANDVGCCLAPALLHFAPELGFALSPKVALSLVGRIGLPLGANITGHSPVAPAALLRLRYASGPGGDGAQVSGSLGGGILRNTIKLGEAVGDGMDTDIVASGPLLLGAGVGYAKALSAGSKTKIVAALNVLVGLPVVDEVGQAAVNFGVQADASLGVQVGF